MFQVLFEPYEGVEFWKTRPEGGSSIALAWVRPNFARVLISVEKGQEEIGLPLLEALACLLNDSPSLKLSKVILRFIKGLISDELDARLSEMW